jgi:membrane protease YdiL (CAAX protease family)
VLSFGLVACLEELFYRGYCQRRLAEDWGDGPAIVGASLLFVFSHGQYLSPNLYNLCMVFTVLVLAVGFGVIFAWTRSLIPSMLAHAIINVPMVPHWAAGFLVAYVVIGIIVVRRGGLSVVKQVFRGTRILSCIALGVAGIAWAIASQRVDNLEIVGTVIVVIAVCLEYLDRRRLGTSHSLEQRVSS